MRFWGLRRSRCHVNRSTRSYQAPVDHSALVVVSTAAHGGYEGGKRGFFIIEERFVIARTCSAFICDARFGRADFGQARAGLEIVDFGTATAAATVIAAELTLGANSLRALSPAPRKNGPGSGQAAISLSMAASLAPSA